VDDGNSPEWLLVAVLAVVALAFLRAPGGSTDVRGGPAAATGACRLD
jgi:hypothetical protein